MKKVAIIRIFCIFLTTVVYGQKYKTNLIIAKADSILRTELGDTLFSYAKYDKNTYYEYKSILGKKKWETLDKNKRTKGKFIEVDMRWFVVIPFPNCPDYDTIKGMTSYRLDNLLRPIEKPYLEFIPENYWEKKKCNLISKEVAIEIARRDKLAQGIEPLIARLVYERKEKLFFWEITNYLTRNRVLKDFDSGQVETVKIDANTGKVVTHDVCHYGPIF